MAKEKLATHRKLARQPPRVNVSTDEEIAPRCERVTHGFDFGGVQHATHYRKRDASAKA